MAGAAPDGDLQTLYEVVATSQGITVLSRAHHDRRGALIASDA
jgi:hypothetical protein